MFSDPTDRFGIIRNPTKIPKACSGRQFTLTITLFGLTFRSPSLSCPLGN